jgi:hypothetical protein
MIELKVHCDCGQKYKFDVEPVNGKMPFTVACPICKRDGTAKANVLLQQMSIFKMVEPAPGPTPASTAPPPVRVSVAPSVAAATAPPPIAPAPIAPPPPAAAGPAKLRINTSAHAEAPAPSEGAPPPLAPALGAAPPPIGARPRLGMTAPAAVEPGKEPSFAMGLLGGFAGALIGGIIYYIIYKTTGLRIGLLALGVGGLAGWAANFLGKGEGSKELGGITAVFVIACVIGAQYLVALERWHKIVGTYQDAGYSESIAEAKKVVTVVPTGSDGEIRMYLAKQSVEDGEAIKPASVSDDDVKEFREKQLPEYQDLASGKVTKDQYLAKMGLDSDKMKKFQDEEEGTFKGVFLLILFSRVGIISLIAGAGLAYKLTANA